MQSLRIGGCNLLLHEILYLGIGIALCVAVPIRSDDWHGTLLVLLCLLCYLSLLRLTRIGSSIRLIGSYIATWALYAGSSKLVDWMHIPLQNAWLLQLDSVLFGQTPSLLFQGLTPGWLIEVLALAYMSYHLYLHWVLIDAVLRDDKWRIGVSQWIFLAFGAGFIGYFLCPAAPPCSIPGFYSDSLNSGFFYNLNESIIGSVAAKYDAFPSLHALITFSMLAWDWTHFRVRFWIMLFPASLMLVATLALRFHYAIDLIASLLIFGILMLVHACYDRNSSRPLGA